MSKTAIMSNEFIVEYRPFDKIELNWTCYFDSTLSKGQNFVRHRCQKRQPCRSNVRLCRKNRSIGSIRQCCFYIVAGGVGALRRLTAPCDDVPHCVAAPDWVWTQLKTHLLILHTITDSNYMTLLTLHQKLWPYRGIKMHIRPHRPHAVHNMRPIGIATCPRSVVTLYEWVVIALALEGNEVGATISGNLISNLRCADDNLW